MASPPALPPVRPPHHPGLDGLRGIAVLLVLYCHAPQLFGRNDGSDGAFWANSRGAWLGVDLFFVLSGFLITGLLLHDRGRPHALRRFWLRRALRIFPLAFLYLAVLAAALALVPGLAPLRDPGAIWWAATYTINFRIAAQGWGQAPFDILWSLAVEEHFYLVWPLLALFVPRRALGLVLVLLVASAPALRLALADQLAAPGVYVATYCRWDTLACGALLALGWHGPARPWLERAARWLLLPATAWLWWVVDTPIPAADPAAPPWFAGLGLSAVAVAFTVWVAAALQPPRWLEPWLTGSWLRATGRISYGLYVWHILVAHALNELLAALGLAPRFPLRVWLWLVAVFAVAAASYRWFEAPLLRLRERFEPPARG